MGHRQDDRSSRMGSRGDGPHGSAGGGSPDGPGRGREGGAPPRPQRGEPGRAFDRNEDMGGSHWSGASGRGGYGPDTFDRGVGRPGQGGYPNQGGYRSGQSGYDRRDEYGRYPNQGGYVDSRDYAEFRYANEGRHEDHDEGNFLTEDSPGHIPNQRWSGGYGADSDRERERAGYEASGPPSGRGFTSNDFGGFPQQRERAYGTPADMERRHFGSVVDRGGRMGPGGSYGFRTTDMGMGSDEDRGPHYGKGPKGYKRSDDRTREEVCDAIAYPGYIDASDVEVKVADGIVTLSGTVTHRHEKRQLEHLVERCRGVLEVHNELRLKRSDAGREKPEKQKPEKGTDTGDGSSSGNANGKTAPS